MEQPGAFQAGYRRGGLNTRAVADKELTEGQFQAWLMEQARQTGWLAFHDYDSRGNPKGFLDTVLVRDHLLLFAELKNMTHKPTPEQEEWIAALRAVTEVRTFLWRPSDRGTIETMLNAVRR